MIPNARIPQMAESTSVGQANNQGTPSSRGCDSGIVTDYAIYFVSEEALGIKCTRTDEVVKEGKAGWILKPAKFVQYQGQS